MRQKKALFVDDDVEYLLKLINIVEPLGFDCKVMSDSQQASEVLSRERFDVLVTDIAMPGMNGYEVIRRLRSLDAQTFVIAISGQEDENVESKAIKNGANAFFHKPLELEIFLKTLSVFLNGKNNGGDLMP